MDTGTRSGAGSPGTWTWCGLLALGLATGVASCRDDRDAHPGANDETGSHLLVSSSRGNDIVRFDQQTGAFIDVLVPADGTLDHPDWLALRDGHLYVSSGTSPVNSAILRFDIETGEYVDSFATDGGLHRPYGFAFGPDGYLYVASFLSDQILRYHGDTGAFVDVLAQGDGRPGGLNGPDAVVFGPDGALYVTTQGSVAVSGEPTFPGLPSEVLRLDPSTGLAEVVVTDVTPMPDSAGFVSLLGAVFGPDCPATCDLFVSDFANGVRRYDRNGNLLQEISTSYTDTPTHNSTGSLALGDQGRLFVAGFDSSEDAGYPGVILRYDGHGGAPLPAKQGQGAVFVPANQNLVRPIAILALPGQRAAQNPPCVARYSRSSAVVSRPSTWFR
jgi:sugar lactone lactonase YvrE